MMVDLIKLKNLILQYNPESKIIISAPLLRTDKFNANENNKKFIEFLRVFNFSCIYHDNIIEKHLDRYGLHINFTGSASLAKNLLSGMHDF